MAKKIILLNGPAGSGKDILGLMLTREFHRAKVFKFAAPIKKAMAAFFNLNEDDYQYFFEGPGKNEPHYRFFNKTPREWLIRFSEEFVKPFAGETAFGELAAAYLEHVLSGTILQVAIFTDCGFQTEVNFVIDKFHKQCNIFLFRLHRNGKTFGNDSRGYVTPEDSRLYQRDIFNVEGAPHVAINDINHFMRCNNEKA